MDIAAPIQNLWGKLTEPQRADATRRIIDTVGQHRRGSAIGMPIAVRIVSAQKPR
jgi:hypothetical protein